MTLVDEIERLERLYTAGAVTSEEYSRAKAVLLDGYGAPARRGEAGRRADDAPPPAGRRAAREWAVLLHLSQFAGWVAPVVLWQLKKDEVPGLDVHGRHVANWLLSMLVYLVGSAVLCVVLVGVPLLLATLLMGVVFPVVGAVRAARGRAWRYPLTIEFV